MPRKAILQRGLSCILLSFSLSFSLSLSLSLSLYLSIYLSVCLSSPLAQAAPFKGCFQGGIADQFEDRLYVSNLTAEWGSMNTHSLSKAARVRDFTSRLIARYVYARIRGS